jgi:hypothetical protein
MLGSRYTYLFVEEKMVFLKNFFAAPSAQEQLEKSVTELLRTTLVQWLFLSKFGKIRSMFLLNLEVTSESKYKVYSGFSGIDSNSIDLDQSYLVCLASLAATTDAMIQLVSSDGKRIKSQRTQKFKDLKSAKCSTLKKLDLLQYSDDETHKETLAIVIGYTAYCLYGQGEDQDEFMLGVGGKIAQWMNTEPDNISKITDVVCEAVYHINTILCQLNTELAAKTWIGDSNLEFKTGTYQPQSEFAQESLLYAITNGKFQDVLGPLQYLLKETLKSEIL